MGYAQIAKSCKVYEESMQNELNRKKQEMEQMFVKKMDILKKRIYKEVRDEMQSEMDKECMKMYKMQERAQSDFGKLNVLRTDNEKQMNEIHALKMKMIENNQKFENMESEKQSLLSKICKLEKQNEHKRTLKMKQQQQIKSMSEQIKMEREKSQFQFALMEKKYKKN